MLALLGAVRPAEAQEDAVRIECDSLSPDDAAQVEARIRATLLTELALNVSVRVECVDATASIRVVSGDRPQEVALSLPDENRRDAVLAAVERLLENLEHEATATAEASSAPSAAVIGVRPNPPPKQASALASPSPVAPARVIPAKGSATRWDTGAGALAELWEGAVAYGARILAVRQRPAWSLGVDFGWLTSPALTDTFRTHELHAFAFGAVEDQRITGVRAALGLGVSVLKVLPEPDIIVHSRTTLPLSFLNLELARPVRFGRLWILPAVDVRLFPGRREVIVDAERRLVLPPVCPALFLGVGYVL